MGPETHGKRERKEQEELIVVTDRAIHILLYLCREKKNLLVSITFVGSGETYRDLGFFMLDPEASLSCLL